MTGNKTVEAELKRQKKFKENKEKVSKEKENLVKKIQSETKEQLLPSIQLKMIEIVNYVTDLLKEDDQNINASQVMSLLARKSLNEMAMSTYQISYTPQEIAIAFNIYLDMIDKINKVTKFPPTIHSFTTMLGITAETFNNWLADSEKKEIASYIKSYLIGTINTSTLVKDIDTIAGIYTTKTMGLVEQAQPIQHKIEVKTDIESIQKQIQSLKKDNIIDAEWEEKDE